MDDDFDILRRDLLKAPFSDKAEERLMDLAQNLEDVYPELAMSVSSLMELSDTSSVIIDHVEIQTKGNLFAVYLMEQPEE